ncbi:hypothetical protein KZJ38_21900 [Paraburkholderia edwinii]|uniref:Uncharacterized protein n=1 Tax=Paraburkholderia edwinii TaxID=2861782 RepID=A0ABX8UPC9_9BURK|nr:hypothetical protein [Paraburkholderia edwinii]QYD68830.1 hypothetical protein KZJ38_21900 [Paraburkholderia edwinii]
MSAAINCCTIWAPMLSPPDFVSPPDAELPPDEQLPLEQLLPSPFPVLVSPTPLEVVSGGE